MVVTDTAGLRETQDEIEAEGVSRAKEAAGSADIVVAVADVAAPELDADLLQWAATLSSGELPGCPVSEGSEGNGSLDMECWVGTC